MSDDPIGTIAVLVISVLTFLASHVLVRRTPPPRMRRLIIDALAGSVFLFAVVSASIMRGLEYALTQAVIIGFFTAAFIRLVLFGIWYCSDRYQADWQAMIDDFGPESTPYNGLPEYFLRRVGGIDDESVIAESVERQDRATSNDDTERFFRAVALPYTIELLQEMPGDEQIEPVFGFFEYMANHEDPRIRDLLDDIVCTELAVAGPEILTAARRYMGPATLDFSHRNAVEHGFEKPWPDDSPELWTSHPNLG